jgi:hypothetical protein
MTTRGTWLGAALIAGLVYFIATDAKSQSEKPAPRPSALPPPPKASTPSGWLAVLRGGVVTADLVAHWETASETPGNVAMYRARGLPDYFDADWLSWVWLTPAGRIFVPNSATNVDVEPLEQVATGKIANADRRGETVYAVPEARYTDNKAAGWEKTGKSVIYVPSAQARGVAMTAANSPLQTAGDFFRAFGAPSLFWTDLGQWEWGNVPVGLLGMDQDRRANAAVQPGYAS